MSLSPLGLTFAFFPFSPERSVAPPPLVSCRREAVVGWLANVAVLVVLVFLNGLLALSEIAVVSARKTRLMKWAARGNRGAQAALDLQREPGTFLSTIQTGITLVGILAGAFGGATLADPLAKALAPLDLPAATLHAVALGAVVVAITYVSILFGELLPKHLALSRPEKLATLAAPPLKLFAALASPVVGFLSFSTRILLRLFGIQRPEEAPVTGDEIRILLDQGARAGTFQRVERDMVHGVLRLGRRRAADLMTPRTEVVWLEDDAGKARLLEILRDHPHGRYPVARGSLDNLLGVVHTRDLLTRELVGKPFDLRSCLRPPVFVPEGTPALKLLDAFRENRVHLVFVVDEYGALQGVVSLHDLLENVVGDISFSPIQEEPEAVRREDGSWLLDGLMPLDRFKEIFGLERLPGEERGLFHTLAGFAMARLGRVPRTADHFVWRDLRFEVVDMDGRRVDKVLVTPLSGGPKAKEDRP